MDYVLPHFMQILDGDMGFGDQRTSDPNWVQLKYDAPRKTGYAQTAVFNAVNGTPNDPILIRAVESNFILPSDGTTAAYHGGVTIFPSQRNSNDPMIIYYDAYDCSGLHHWAKGLNQAQIGFPPWIALFHELIHATRFADGFDQTTPNEEPFTIGEENKLRAQYSLPLRDPAGHDFGGCDFKDPAASSTKNSYCFLTTAAYDSFSHDRLTRAKLLMNKYLTESPPVIRLFVLDLIAEYNRFSPTIANLMHQDERLKNTVKSLVVEPLLDYYTLLDSYVFGDRGSFESAVVDYLRRARKDRALVTNADDPSTVITTDVEAGPLGDAAWLHASSLVAPNHRRMLEPTLQLFRTAMVDASVHTSAWEWCFFSPLRTVWNARLQCQANIPIDKAAQAWCSATYEWVRAVPIESVLS
jgi:hypothetical protein